MTRPLGLALQALLILVGSLGVALPRADAAAADSGRAAPAKTLQQILDDAPDSDWRALDADNTLYLQLDSGLVVIELAPAFAPEHVANIRALARASYWDGLAITRVQDNFVVQWGDPADTDASRKALPVTARSQLPAEFTRSVAGLAFDALPDVDGWAPQVGFSNGFAVGMDRSAGRAWLAHCYGMVGAGRDNAPDSSNGTELYVVIGQAPRQLDRNMSSVGRVAHGIERLSALPRGSGPLGFYADAAQRLPIRSIRLGSQLAPAERLPLQALRSDSASFAAMVEARRNRRDAFYQRPAGHIDLCNVPQPIRLAPAAAR